MTKERIEEYTRVGNFIHMPYCCFEVIEHECHLDVHTYLLNERFFRNPLKVPKDFSDDQIVDKGIERILLCNGIDFDQEW